MMSQILQLLKDQRVGRKPNNFSTLQNINPNLEGQIYPLSDSSPKITQKQ